MYDLNIIGKSVPRKESLDKVTDAARYTDDYEATGLLHARMVTSPYAHAKIKAIEYENSLIKPNTTINVFYWVIL